MSGFRRKRLSAAFLVFGLACVISASCQSTETADPDLTSPTSRPTTTTEAPSTTATTRPSTTPTTLSELEQAEIDIEAVIQAWWTYPIDDVGYAWRQEVAPYRQ